ncbi:coproporphyrinogen III oxidase [Leptolyngbya boryana NIES-2135]|jgi:oxygen-independent coproporphyrinogen-3 oxidase|uniref:Coproporphyrinogen-III oxidase n=2 Tax=Leptolyngbya boryana TaxID=1184 RepID=A0A1Z4JHV3_LEPBY|nr:MULTISPECIES: oxygen-independent coproporphyrinogen III oxidase [Leptolyngbya]BAO73238.1 oxygen-independent coproporphyrinogen III oxidase [Leptolyngbya boryana]BAY56355.1 coproporphyrinogen III oxidase [Leptolyngbya boryana NIES-2135]MBD2366462.1 oxygen-independent coproporphyrinogen III oxidase [Leptolyngbya sp. FACHB-161]MBD2372641.1 oxygen-independent coproporphyrinogen III oxidase [Leptolyngbya sp. FACHB-238]MBD2397064.1 oxygen-independent coproporphyrinogen III oxidase [Leptolyngbya s
MKQLSQTVEFDAALLNQYNLPLPRYTSYPPATELSPDFDPHFFDRAIDLGNHKKTPLSLYCHIPFCETPCYFCGCNTIITQRREVAEPYLGYLARQIRQVAQSVSSDRQVHQLHWGGGTPNYLDLQQVEFLWNRFHRYFRFDATAELSIEINPRYVDRHYIHSLRQLGFNRISFGIQDFNPEVQVAINRVQPEAMLFDVMDWIREAGFESVNVDLIYGLPFQTSATFQQTVEKTLALNPDRIAVFNFAYIPWLKPVQKRMPESALPSTVEKFKILQNTIAQLTQSNYVFIGMDHFAKPNDELAIAQQAGQLHRNFQGYTTKPESDLLGFGITSISMLQDVYIQNHKRLRDFYTAIDASELPIEKGVLLSQDDLIRRTVIMELMCQFQLSAADLEAKYHLGFDQDFNDYFADELSRLDALEADGLLKRWSDGIEITPVGRLLIRNIAAVFDTYLGDRKAQTFSKSI